MRNRGRTGRVANRVFASSGKKRNIFRRDKVGGSSLRWMYDESFTVEISTHNEKEER